MNIGGILGHILSTSGFILSILIFSPHTPVHTSPKAVVTPAAGSLSFFATEHYMYEGHTIAVAFSIPKNGGDVTGSISGDCTGDITGKYDGAENGKISGEAHATCHVFLLSIPISGTYDGVVHKEDKKIDVNVDVKANGFEKSQDITLSLH